MELDIEEVEEEDEDNDKQSYAYVGTCCSLQCVVHFLPAKLHQLLTLFPSIEATGKAITSGKRWSHPEWKKIMLLY